MNNTRQIKELVEAVGRVLLGSIIGAFVILTTVFFMALLSDLHAATVNDPCVKKAVRHSPVRRTGIERVVVKSSPRPKIQCLDTPTTYDFQEPEMISFTPWVPFPELREYEKGSGGGGGSVEVPRFVYVPVPRYYSPPRPPVQVPEPSTLLLMAGGLLGFMRKRS